ncbi:MAG: DUF3761 domain-containing protein, partial [Acetobacteraceae bacterium]|nr:DUF3761 domain-containing protein [Acetobacteraceae bacterium]
MRMIRVATAVVGLMVAGAAWAQAPAGAPAGSTGLCKDGSYTSQATKRGACHGHKGVQTWYAAAAAPSGGGSAETAAPAKSASAPAAAPAAPATPAASTSANRQQAPGGGAGQVWVNAKSKVYHCQGDRWYGKTKEGSYMTEAEAKAQGN